VLSADGLTADPVTSGSKGMQLYAAISGAQPGEVVVAYARGLAARLPPEIRKIVVATMAKSARSGRVFLDWSQNQPAKTTITPYSLRGRAVPQVAAPRSWDELADASGLTQLSYQEVAERLREPAFRLPDPSIAGPALPA
jgi:bifunctional non-homologous end joining protein LigD